MVGQFIVLVGHVLIIRLNSTRIDIPLLQITRKLSVSLMSKYEKLSLVGKVVFHLLYVCDIEHVVAKPQMNKTIKHATPPLYM